MPFTFALRTSAGDLVAEKMALALVVYLSMTRKDVTESERELSLQQGPRVEVFGRDDVLNPREA
ncbi:hypothetical protein [Streptomyces mirabilis]|uniref:hypothetical protein n=1 Tax=Streptomyces mirabilis TaxID=68239 RepID=UPI0036E74FE6